MQIISNILFVFCIKIDAQRTKRTRMQFADNASPDHPVQSHRLIGVFVARFQTVDTVAYVDQQIMSRSDCTDAHAYLDICRSLTAYVSSPTLIIRYILFPITSSSCSYIIIRS